MLSVRIIRAYTFVCRGPSVKQGKTAAARRVPPPVECNTSGTVPQASRNCTVAESGLLAHLNND